MLTFAIILSAVVAASPVATPPPTIVHTSSSPFCTQLREKAGVAVAGLIANDKLVAQAKELVRKMAHDYRNGTMHSSFNSAHAARVDSFTPQMKLNVSNLQTTVAQLESNLAAIDGLLKDVKTPYLHDELQAVRDQQAHSANILAGLGQTYDLEDLSSFTDPLGGMVASTEPATGTHNAALSAGSLIDDFDSRLEAGIAAAQSASAAKKGGAKGASQGMPTAAQQKLLEAIAGSEDPTVRLDQFLANSPYYAFYVAVVLNQGKTADAEQTLALVTMNAAAQCRR